MPKSLHDVHSPSDPRRNRWKKKHPEIFTHWEALAASSSSLCHKPLLCLSPATPGCHTGVGVDQRRLWSWTELWLWPLDSPISLNVSYSLQRLRCERTSSSTGRWHIRALVDLNTRRALLTVHVICCHLLLTVSSSFASSSSFHGSFIPALLGEADERVTFWQWFCYRPWVRAFFCFYKSMWIFPFMTESALP